MYVVCLQYSINMAQQSPGAILHLDKVQDGLFNLSNPALFLFPAIVLSVSIFL